MMLKPETSAMIRNLRILVVGVGAGGNDLLKNLVLIYYIIIFKIYHMVKILS